MTAPVPVAVIVVKNPLRPVSEVPNRDVAVATPMAIVPFAFTLKSEVVAAPLELVDEAMSNNGWRLPKVPCNPSLANKDEVPIFTEFAMYSLVVDALVPVAFT